MLLFVSRLLQLASCNVLLLVGIVENTLRLAITATAHPVIVDNGIVARIIKYERMYFGKQCTVLL